MKTFASSLLIWAAITVAALAMARPTLPSPQIDHRASSLRSSWIARDPISSPPALQQRFGRDTLLYFPMESRSVDLPVVALAVTAPASR